MEEKRENRQNREPPRLNIKSGVCVCMRVSFWLCRVSRVRFPAFPAVPILCKKPDSEGHRGGHTPTHRIPPQLEICPLGHTHRKPSKDAEQQPSKQIMSQRHVNQKATFILRCHHLDKGHCNWKPRRSTLSVFSPSPPLPYSCLSQINLKNFKPMMSPIWPQRQESRCQLIL